MDAEARRDILLQVALGENLTRWTRVLKPRPTASAVLAMQMLTDLERRHVVEGYCEHTATQHTRADWRTPFILFVVVVIACICLQKKTIHEVTVLLCVALLRRIRVLLWIHSR